MEKIKLKQCPFCGSIPDKELDETDYVLRFTIHCQKCRCAKVTTAVDKRDITFDSFAESVESAVKKCIVTWETRSGEK